MNITIEELKALTRNECGGEKIDHGFCISVLGNGFVYVGDCVEEGKHLTITNSRNIRRWGTTKGLGELVDGPKEDTILDPCGTVVANINLVNHLIKCNRKW